MSIEERDGEFCAVSSDGTQEFGCFATREKAEERLREVEFFKSPRVDDLGAALKGAIDDGRANRAQRAAHTIAPQPEQGKRKKPKD